MTYGMEDSDNAVVSGAGRAAKKILDEIISGDLKAGSRLYIKDLAARTELGPTPLREGISRLIASGLVKPIDQRGFQVTRIESSDLDEFTLFRLLLEEAALQESIGGGDAAWEEGVAGTLAEFAAFSSHDREKPRDAIMRFSHLHRAFHVSLIAACTSRRLREHLELLYDQEVFYCHNLISKNARLADLRALHDIDDHSRLAETVLARDQDGARRALSSHLRQLSAMLRERMGPRGAGGSARAVSS